MQGWVSVKNIFPFVIFFNFNYSSQYLQMRVTFKFYRYHLLFGCTSVYLNFAPTDKRQLSFLFSIYLCFYLYSGLPSYWHTSVIVLVFYIFMSLFVFRFDCFEGKWCSEPCQASLCRVNIITITITALTINSKRYMA